MGGGAGTGDAGVRKWIAKNRRTESGWEVERSRCPPVKEWHWGTWGSWRGNWNRKISLEHGREKWCCWYRKCDSVESREGVFEAQLQDWDFWQGTVKLETPLSSLSHFHWVVLSVTWGCDICTFFCSNASIFVDFGYDWYFVVSLNILVNK